MRELINTDNNWYKGNFHMHTTRSDGHLDVSNAIETYRKNGYDFVAVTDHRHPGTTIEPNQTGMLEDTKITTKDMLLLNGVEWDTGGRNTDLEGDVPTFHILGIGMTSNEMGKNFSSIRHPSPEQIINVIKKDGGFAVLAHPCWSVMDPMSINEVKGVDAAEIYNAVSGIPWNGDRCDSSTWFDIWATHYGILMPAVAGDDTHAYSGDECRTFTMVNAKELSRDAILEALYHGNFYASQGPKIQTLVYDEESHILHLECSKNVMMAVFYSNHIWVKNRVTQIKDGICEYHVNEGETYIRVELITNDGKKAWTSPFSMR